VRDIRERPQLRPAISEVEKIYGDVSVFPAAINPDLIKAGLIFSYAPNLGIFKCPADKKKAVNGALTVRSMSMNAMVGDPGELTNRFNPDYVQFFKTADIGKPSDTFVFLDEHPDTINDGFFVNRLNDYTWGNLPASYHNGAANLSYADGHIASHRWQIADTIRPPVQGGVGGTFPANPTTDFDWLKERTSVKKQ